MISDQVAELEKRASASEDSIAIMKTMLQKMQAAQSATSGSDDVVLESKLRELLDLMKKDQRECEEIRAQYTEIKEENERLRTQVEKHEYRIKHLLRNMDEIEVNCQKQ